MENPKGARLRSRANNPVELKAHSASFCRGCLAFSPVGRSSAGAVSRLGVIAMRSSRAVEEEVHTHKYLWRSASMLVEKAKVEEQASYHLVLPALMMSILV